MEFTDEMRILQGMYPQIKWSETEAIRQYWRVFYENPRKYKGTPLETMVFDWLKGDGKQVVEKWEDSRRRFLI